MAAVPIFMPSGNISEVMLFESMAKVIPNDMPMIPATSVATVKPLLIMRTALLEAFRMPPTIRIIAPRAERIHAMVMKARVAISFRHELPTALVPVEHSVSATHIIPQHIFQRPATISVPNRSDSRASCDGVRSSDISIRFIFAVPLELTMNIMHHVQDT